jgi:hypothetical protein
MRDIAIETKKDGTSLKTIAILGMIFLPTVFVLLLWALAMGFRSDSRAAGVGSKALRTGAHNV